MRVRIDDQLAARLPRYSNHVAVGTVMAATGSNLESDTILPCKNGIFMRDEPGMGKHIHIAAGAGGMVGPRRHRFNRSLAVHDDDACPVALCLPRTGMDERGGNMGEFHPDKQADPVEFC